MGLIAELKRRNVFRVAVAYAVIAWLLAQVADLAFDNFGAPDWVPKSFLFMLILGFPLAVFFAWAFELTPEGLKREKEVDRAQSITHRTGRKLDYTIIALLVLAVGFLLFERFTAPGEEPAAVADAETEVTTSELERSIAVLPFDNRSNREEDQFFTDGIHDDLLTTIANIGSLKVISRTSVMEYRETTKKIPQIAQELGVGNILEGGVQRSGTQVRINVQLIDAETDEHLWAEIYDRELTAENLFKIQSEVSNAIADALHATLSPEDLDRINSVGTTNLEAYEKYLLGRARWRERTAESLDAAVRLFLDAVDLDPGYAAAWAGLSDAYRLQPGYAAVPFDDAIAKAEFAVERALALDDGLAEAHTALASQYASRGEYERAIESFEYALQLNPNYEWAYVWYGSVVEELGDVHKASDLYRKAAQLDPLSIVANSNLVTAYEATGEFEASLARAHRIIEIAPDSTMGYRAVASYHSRVLNRLDESVRWYLRGLEKAPDDVRSIFDLVFAYLALGDVASADRWADRLRELGPGGFQVRVVELARALAAGDEAAALLAARSNYDEFSDVIGPYTWPFMIVNRDDIESGRPDEAMARIVDAAPELESGSSREFTWNALMAGPTAVLIHEQAGRMEEARTLADRLLEHSEQYPLQGYWGYIQTRARVHAALGDVDAALDEYENFVDAGFGDAIPLPVAELEILYEEPRYQALRERIEARMAEQRDNLRDVGSSFEW
jgi:TolB-like protein/cytochrome c-type biogenesis protein CcmH/NrfG